MWASCASASSVVTSSIESVGVAFGTQPWTFSSSRYQPSRATVVFVPRRKRKRTVCPAHVDRSTTEFSQSCGSPHQADDPAIGLPVPVETWPSYGSVRSVATGSHEPPPSVETSSRPPSRQPTVNAAVGSSDSICCQFQNCSVTGDWPAGTAIGGDTRRWSLTVAGSTALNARAPSCVRALEAAQVSPVPPWVQPGAPLSNDSLNAVCAEVPSGQPAAGAVVVKRNGVDQAVPVPHALVVRTRQ